MTNEKRPAIEPLALRAPEAAAALGISERALWTLTNCGDVPSVRIGRSITYPVASLRAWLEQRAKGGRSVGRAAGSKE